MLELFIMDSRQITKQFQASPNFVDEENRIIEGVIHYETTDREGDYIAMDGVEWDDFMLNPHVTIDHDIHDSRQTVGKVLSLRIDGKKLIARMEFDDDFESDQIYRKMVGGSLSAFSPDWYILSSDEERREIDGRMVNYVSRAKLLSVSVVPIPMNQKATTRTKSLTKNKRLDKFNDKKINPKGKFYMESKQIEQLADAFGERVSKSLIDVQDAIKQKQADEQQDARNAFIDEQMRLAQKQADDPQPEPEQDPASDDDENTEPQPDDEFEGDDVEKIYRKQLLKHLAEGSKFEVNDNE